MTVSHGDVSVLWAALETPERCAWGISPPPGVRFLVVPLAGLAPAVQAARARGPVVAIVSSHRDAHRALAVGVDEVVRVGAATAEALLVAVESARLRAVGRDTHPTEPEADARAIELLAASVSYRLASPLAVAALNVEVLRTAMGAITGLADEYAREAALRRELPDSEAQRVVAMRASAPTSTTLAASFNDLTIALREASSAVGTVRALVGERAVEDPCDLVTVVSEVTQLVRIVIERVATLCVELPRESGGRCAVSRSLVVQALSALLTNALHAVRDSEARGVIVVRVEPRVSAAIVEVIDNGVGMGADECARVLDPVIRQGDGRARASSLAVLSERLRREGGEIVVESERGVGTTARLFLPLRMVPETADPAAN